MVARKDVIDWIMEVLQELDGLDEAYQFDTRNRLKFSNRQNRAEQDNNFKL